MFKVFFSVLGTAWQVQRHMKSVLPFKLFHTVILHITVAEPEMFSRLLVYLPCN